MPTQKDKEVLQPSIHAPKWIPVQTLIELSEKGLNGTQIAKIVGISRNAVCQSFKRHNYTPQHLKAYQSAKAAVYDHYQDQVLRTLTPAEIKKAPLAARTMLFGVLYDKARLERGQSTTNIQALTALITSIHATTTDTEQPDIIDTAPVIDAIIDSNAPDTEPETAE